MLIKTALHFILLNSGDFEQSKKEAGGIFEYKYSTIKKLFLSIAMFPAVGRNTDNLQIRQLKFFINIVLILFYGLLSPLLVIFVLQID
jgi:hypothetical protein